MKKVDFREMRVLIDKAITYNDLAVARDLSKKALEAATFHEALGERLYFMAQLAILDENFSEAMKYLDGAIRYNANDGAAYNDRALCMVELGMLEGVIAYFDSGISVEPDFATIHHNKGWFLNKTGRHREAIGCFHRALELEPRRAVTYENLADCLFNLGRMEEAIEAYQKALAALEAHYVEIREQIEKLIKILRVIQSKKIREG